MATAIVHHPVFAKHDTGPQHPESPSRYSVVMDALRGDTDLWPGLIEVQAKEAPRGDVQACHTPQMYKNVEHAVKDGLGSLDADTTVSLHSLEAALAWRGSGLPGNRSGDERRGDKCLCAGASAGTSRDRGARDGFLPFQ